MLTCETAGIAETGHTFPQSAADCTAVRCSECVVTGDQDIIEGCEDCWWYKYPLSDYQDCMTRCDEKGYSEENIVWWVQCRDTKKLDLVVNTWKNLLSVKILQQYTPTLSKKYESFIVEISLNNLCVWQHVVLCACRLPVTKQKWRHKTADWRHFWKWKEPSVSVLLGVK